MDTFKQIFTKSPQPCFTFDTNGLVKDINELGREFLVEWNVNSEQLNERNLKILLYQVNLGLQNLEIYCNDKYYRFEVVHINDNEYSYYGYNVTIQKNIADTLFNLVDDVEEALFMVDLETQGKIVELNKTATRYLGYNREDFFTMNLKDIVYDFDLFSQDDWDRHATKIKNSENSSIVKIGELVRKDRTRFPVEMVFKIKHLMEKDFQLILVRDITERLKEEKLQENMKLQMFSSAKLSQLGEMATSVAHEINNPLTVIVASSYNLRKILATPKPDLAKALISLDKVENTIKSITKVIGSLRNISKDVENNEFRNAEIIEVINDVVNLSQDKMSTAGIKFEIIGAESLEGSIIQYDRPQISRVILNMINNSVEAIEGCENPWLTLDLSCSEAEVKFKVTDSGNGIPAELLDKIFEPFYSTKILGHGTGLGLSTSRAVAISHSGRFEYDYTSTNTCFYLILPNKRSKG